MGVKFTYDGVFKIVETLANNTASAAESNRKVTHDLFNKKVELDGNSSIPATKTANFQVTIPGGGSTTIDLRALTGTNGASVDGNGLKVQGFKFQTPVGNSNVISIDEGSANGYALLGASFALDLQPDNDMQALLSDKAPDVSDTEKILDVSGTSGDVLNVQIVLG